MFGPGSPQDLEAPSLFISKSLLLLGWRELTFDRSTAYHFMWTENSYKFPFGFDIPPFNSIWLEDLPLTECSILSDLFKVTCRNHTWGMISRQHKNGWCVTTATVFRQYDIYLNSTQAYISATLLFDLIAVIFWVIIWCNWPPQEEVFQSLQTNLMYWLG